MKQIESDQLSAVLQGAVQSCVCGTNGGGLDICIVDDAQQAWWRGTLGQLDQVQMLAEELSVVGYSVSARAIDGCSCVFVFDSLDAGE